ncbi:5'/3'-nucleotidase SurE [Rubidibacter lacunae KORDI 51-2]|uniref:5'-nucleotidase n=1 Tax=Rubidibacter lacunae KORDI 51-2 TaxID=582515 RepID=U5DPB2_9CHRO|nr:5'/3'-nucleotidase SurE [Rubidibacter lacunae]ERN42449.1 5'/3'-nucleotidase SurE [Rubidibacter lacunae KORDI 51-2]
MTIILTNDDGIDAPGLQALQDAIDGKGVMFAPDREYSGCGHQVTTQRALKLQQRGDRAFCLDGTPADCSRIALTQKYPDARWVLSGINAGGNLGIDVYMSGTVAAVREAAILGVPGIALSHWIRRPLPIDWETTARWTRHVLDELMGRSLPPGKFWNVNFPHLDPGSPDPELVFCTPSTQPLPVTYRVEGDRYHYTGAYPDRGRTPGTDVDVCFSGSIAIVQLSL